MKNKLVSIIVPIYNVENYLSECLDSLINQTYRNIEIIAIDDGSTDKGTEILALYEKKDSRIKYFKKSNDGLGHTRNSGIDLCSGNCIIFIDSDDYLEVDTVNILVQNIGNSDILIYNGKSFDDETKIFSKKKYFPINQKEFVNSYTKNNVGIIINLTSACLKIYKTNFIRYNSLKFPEGICGEDVEFWYKCLSATENINYVDYVGYNRRVRQSSITASRTDLEILDRVNNVQQLFFLFGDNPKLKKHIMNYAIWVFYISLLHHKLHILSEIADKYDRYNIIRLSENMPVMQKVKYRIFFKYMKKPRLFYIFHKIIEYKEKAFYILYKLRIRILKNE